jgi:phosphoglycerol transferase MdoB-like AlkP superfamily enzyme
MAFLKKYYGLLIGSIVMLIYCFSFKFSLSNLPKEAIENFNLVDIHISLSKYLIYFILLLCLLFFVYGFKQNPKSGIKFGLGLGILVVLFGLCYAMAGNNPAELGLEDKVSSTNYRLVGAMITTTIVLMFVGAGVLIGLSIKNSIENGKA